MEVKKTYRKSDGVTRTMIWEDDESDTVHVHTEIDMTQAVENNKILSELHPRRSTNKLVARGVPLTVYEQSVQENWDDDRWKRWLNDPDNAAFRVWKGRV